MSPVGPDTGALTQVPSVTVIVCQVPDHGFAPPLSLSPEPPPNELEYDQYEFEESQKIYRPPFNAVYQ